MLFYLGYFFLGLVQGLISTGLISAIANSYAFRAAILDLIIGVSGFIAIDALINKNVAQMILYLIGGSVGTFILVKLRK